MRPGASWGGGALPPDGSRSFRSVCAGPAALRHARCRRDLTTFPGAALPPVNCGARCVCYQTAATAKGGKYDIVERLCREFPGGPIRRARIGLGRAKLLPSSNYFMTSSNFFETFGTFFRRGWEVKPRYPAENEGGGLGPLGGGLGASDGRGTTYGRKRAGLMWALPATCGKSRAGLLPQAALLWLAIFRQPPGAGSRSRRRR